MCQQGKEKPQAEETIAQRSVDFPWEIGAHDAHCHPTDTMASVSLISEMGARSLTIMATRSQDQDLVASVASSHPKAIPSFGWHPWFSYQLYDDTVPAHQRTYNREAEDLQAEKARHLASVLSPPPGEDDGFVADTPPLKSLSEFLSETRARLLAHPKALVGEIGLDKAFRLPQPWTPAADDQPPPPSSDADAGITPGGREGRLLSPHRVTLGHQVSVLTAQLRLAAELGRAVSVHGVQAHGALLDALRALWKGHEREVISRRQKRMVAEGAEDEFDQSSASEDDDDDDEAGAAEAAAAKKERQAKPYPPRICLHSFSGSAEMVRQYTDAHIPAAIFFSFSTAVNFSTPTGESKASDVIKACPDDRILVESDLHIAGDRMDAALEAMYRKVCEIKGWELKDGIERIGRNYREFVACDV